MHRNELGFEDHFTIRAYEIDHRKQATLPALLKLLHEAAMQNVIRLQLSVWDLEPHHLAWVLMRQHTQVHRYPELGERVRILTRPTGFEKAFAYRDYHIWDEADRLLAQAASTWLLMNTRSRRLARIPGFIWEKQPHMPPEDQCLPHPPAKLPPLQQADFTDHFRVRRHQLDFNMHLNNIFYPEWMLDALPPNWLDGRQVEALTLVFRQEAREGDRILAQAQQLDDHTLLHQLVCEADGKKLASGRTKWSAPRS